jgi:molybdopterin molybdotransferase
MFQSYIGFPQALKLTLASVSPLAPEKCLLADGLDAVAAEDIYAAVDSPSVSTSLKDGYAVRSSDIAGATPERPVRLVVTGVAAAGAPAQESVLPGAAVRILTGGRIPWQADAVVAEEFAALENDGIVVDQAIAAGRNVLPLGTDVAAGEKLLSAGDRLTPGRLGLIAAAGLSHVRVHRNPRVAVIATGDEIRLPGTPLAQGQLYASNAVTLEAWCRRLRCETALAIVPDQRDAILATLREAVQTCDAVLTSGGAWSGERDLVRQALEKLQWRMVFHRVRLGPGKGTGMGLVGRRPVFMLPGGPPANLIGFLKLALPALRKMGGHRDGGLRKQRVCLQQDVRGRRDWTQAVFGNFLTDGEGRRRFQPDRQSSRLKSVGHAQALLTVPEEVDQMAAGTSVEVEVLA